MPLTQLDTSRLSLRFAAHRPRLATWAGPLLAAICMLGIFANDRFLRYGEGSFLHVALTDEPAHAVTALLTVAAVATWHRAWRAPAIRLAALLGGTAIDLDHLPDALGWYGLSAGTARPHTHTLATLALLLGIARCKRGARRRALLAAALGLGVHFLRDLVEGSTVPLLWPVTRYGFAVAYGWYAALLVVCVGMIVGGALRQRSHPGTDIR